MHKGMLRYIITIYAPVNLTASCIIFSDRFFSLRGGLGPGTRDFFGAHEIARALRRVRFGAQKSREFQGPIAQVRKKILPEKIMHRAVKFSGALVVLCTRAHGNSFSVQYMACRGTFGTDGGLRGSYLT